MNASYGTTDTLRNVDLNTVARLLTEQRLRALDIVTPASAITAHMGKLIVSGSDGVADATGVTPSEGSYEITGTAEVQLAAALNIPPGYLRRMHASALDLWDANVNGWLTGAGESFYDRRPADARSFLLRLLRGDTDGTGVVRAFLSDQYRMIDNLDVLMATLSGIQDSGAEVHIEGADLTETRMFVRIAAPGVQALAPVLLDGYRSPFRPGGASRVTGASGVDESRWNPQGLPIAFAGFVLSNSETGHGRFTLTPRINFFICTNGMQVTRDSTAQVHFGGKLTEGVVQWSQETRDKELELITGMARDAVTTFLSEEYLTKTVAALEIEAGAPVKEINKTIEVVAQKFAFDVATTESLLEHFMLGGQLTAGGVANAITSVAQTLDDGDEANRLEAKALDAMSFVAAL
jgi:hypothetical protein